MKAMIWIQRLLMTTLPLLLAVAALAQNPGDPGGNPGGNPIGAIPVDGGLGFLLAAGIGYGAKKAYDQRKKKQVQEKE